MQLDKWRLIVDMSHLQGRSANDGIPRHLCSMTYITVDHAVENIITRGPGTLLAKIDIKNTFSLIPVHPDDLHLLAMEWRCALFIDSCLPFGLQSAPTLFPATELEFLGILLDTTCMEARLPEDKFSRIKTKVRELLGKRYTKKRKILSTLRTSILG